MSNIHQSLLEESIDALMKEDFETAREKLKNLISLNKPEKDWIFLIPSSQKDFLEEMFGIETLKLNSPSALAKEFEAYMHDEEELGKNYDPIEDRKRFLEELGSKPSSPKIGNALNQFGAFSFQPNKDIKDTSPSLNHQSQFN